MQNQADGHGPQAAPGGGDQSTLNVSAQGAGPAPLSTIVQPAPLPVPADPMPGSPQWQMALQEAAFKSAVAGPAAACLPADPLAAPVG